MTSTPDCYQWSCSTDIGSKNIGKAVLGTAGCTVSTPSIAVILYTVTLIQCRIQLFLILKKKEERKKSPHNLYQVKKKKSHFKNWRPTVFWSTHFLGWKLVEQFYPHSAPVRKVSAHISFKKKTWNFSVFEEEKEINSSFSSEHCLAVQTLIGLGT